MFLQICKDMICHLQVTHVWICLILRYCGDFIENIDLSEFDGPSQDPNQLHKLCCKSASKLVSHVDSRPIVGRERVLDLIFQ
jgi:hypothetical protein